LEAALDLLHHDRDFTKATRRAVKEWQRSSGRDATGVVNDRMVSCSLSDRSHGGRSRFQRHWSLDCPGCRFGS
jgi:hypothetical protein